MKFFIPGIFVLTFFVSCVGNETDEQNDRDQPLSQNLQTSNSSIDSSNLEARTDDSLAALISSADKTSSYNDPSSSAGNTKSDEDNYAEKRSNTSSEKVSQRYIEKEKKWGNFLDSLQTKTQNFEIDNSKDTVIECKKGTKIYFPAQLFCDEQKKPVEGFVNISIRECYTIGEMIGSKLTTQSTDGMLQTGGMLNIDAQKNNKRLSIREGQNYAIIFKKLPGINRMNLYNGKADQDGFKTWTLDGTYKNETIVKRQPGNQQPSQSNVSVNTPYYKKCVLDLRKGDNEHTSSEMTESPKLAEEKIYQLFEEEIANNRKMRRHFCDCKEHVEIIVTYNEVGKPYGIKFSKSTTPAFDSTLANFFLKVNNDAVMQGLPNSTGDAVRMVVSTKDVKDATPVQHEFNRKYEDFMDKTLEVANVNELENYILVSQGLGWLNCDLLNKFMAKRITAVVEVAVPLLTSVWFVFKDFKTVIPGKVNGSKINFGQMPLGQKVKVIAVDYSQEQPQFATIETIISEEPLKLIRFQSMTLSELNKVLDVRL